MRFIRSVKVTKVANVYRAVEAAQEHSKTKKRQEKTQDMQMTANKRSFLKHKTQINTRLIQDTTKMTIEADKVARMKLWQHTKVDDPK